jgi:hypothetical protein
MNADRRRTFEEMDRRTLRRGIDKRHVAVASNTEPVVV